MIKKNISLPYFWIGAYRKLDWRLREASLRLRIEVKLQAE